MGYAGFSVNQISRALCRHRNGTDARALLEAEGQNASWQELSFISDFLQQIVFQPTPRQGELTQ
jgi:hypothetical protein